MAISVYQITNSKNGLSYSGQLLQEVEATLAK